MKKLIAMVLTAALVMGMSVTAFADDTDEYNEYGMSNIAIDILTHTMEENNAKYNPVGWDTGEDNSIVIKYDNGFDVQYFEWGTDIVTDGDEAGKNLLKYYDASLTTAEQVGAVLAANGYTLIYDYDEYVAGMPAGACYVDMEYNCVNINAGFELIGWPLYWMPHLDVYYQFSDDVYSDY